MTHGVGGGAGSSRAASGPPAFAQAADRAIGGLTLGALVVACACVAAIIVIGTADTVGRALLNRPVMGAVEMTESLLAATIFLALPHAQRMGQQVVVDIVVSMLPRSVRVAAFGIGLVTTLGAFALLAMQALDGAQAAWRIGEVSAGYVPVPIWLAKALAALGLAIAVVETLREIVWLLLWPHLALPERAPDALPMPLE